MAEMEEIRQDLVTRIGIRWGHIFGDPDCACGCKPFNPYS